MKTFIEICKEAVNQPQASFYFFMVILLVSILIIWRKIRNYNKPLKLFSNISGNVGVTKKALDDLVQSVCYKNGALNRPKVEFKIKRGRLSLTVSLKVESGQKLTETTNTIQNALIKVLREHLGVEKLGNINVKIVGFKGLIYKPTNKFLPEIETKDDDTNIMLDNEEFEDSKEEAQSTSENSSEEKNG